MKIKTCPYRIILVDLSKSTIITRFEILTIEKFAGKKYEFTYLTSIYLLWLTRSAYLCI